MQLDQSLNSHFDSAGRLRNPDFWVIPRIRGFIGRAIVCILILFFRVWQKSRRRLGSTMNEEVLYRRKSEEYVVCGINLSAPA